MGIRQLKTRYKPQPYHRKTKIGEHVTYRDRAEKVAEYLEKEHWGNKNDKEGTFPTRHILRGTPTFDMNQITVDEIRAILKRMK